MLFGIWGAGNLSSSNTGLPIQLYDIERGTNVYNGRPTYWIGKVGLMYPSDYGDATSGGPTTSRSDCLNTSMGLNSGGGSGGSANRSLSYLLSTGGFWTDSEYSACKNNDYLHKSSMEQWTMTPSSSYSNNVFNANNLATLAYYNASIGNAVRPTAYLKSSVLITSGDGSKENPYVLSN